MWNVSCSDAIQVLDSDNFEGFVTTTGNFKRPISSLDDVFSGTGIEYEIDESVDITNDDWLRGRIPYTSRRHALQLILFAIGAYADTSYSNKVRIKKAKIDIKSEITLDRIFEGQKVSVESPITELQLRYYNYDLGNESQTVYESSGEESGEVEIVFDEPMGGFSFDGAISAVSLSENRIVVNVNGAGSVSAKKYVSRETIKKAAANVSSIKNQKTINNATLYCRKNVSAGGNLVDVLTPNMEFLSKKKSVTARVIDDGDLFVGERYKIQTKYDGTIEGILVEQAFNLYGGKVVKEVVIK
jgi:hypothetical protein